MKGAWLWLAILALGSWTRPVSAAEPIVAVLSSETGPYREALAGLQQELGAPVPYYSLAQGEPGIPHSARVVITFGSKAALGSHAQARLIYAMAPGTRIDARGAVAIRMEPSASDLLAQLKKLDPGMRRLGILWISPRFGSYADELRSASVSSNITIEATALKTSADIPSCLRGLKGKIDALWLPPDPLTLNPGNLPILVEFSRANKIPMFVPTEGLTEQGATASIGPTFREIGRAAAIAARRVLAGQENESDIFPDSVRVILNKEAAEQMGLRAISSEEIR